MTRSETDLLKLKRGQVWEIDFEPQTHKEEPGKHGRPGLIIQTNILNEAGHATTIIVPATTKTYRDALGDGYPMRVSIGKTGRLKEDTDLLVDQIRTVSNRRFLGDKPVAELSRAHMKRVEEALRVLLGE